MDSNALVQRAQLLQTELQKSKQNVIGLGEQLEQAKAHLHMVTGHLNEVSFLLGEEQKIAQGTPVDTQMAVMDNLNIDSKEQEHGETVNQEQGQAA